MRTSAEVFFSKIKASAGADFNKLFSMAEFSSLSGIRILSLNQDLYESLQKKGNFYCFYGVCLNTLGVILMGIAFYSF